MERYKKYIVNINDKIIGEKFTGKYGDYIVLSATNKKAGTNSRVRLFLCKFLQPEYYGFFTKGAILDGKVKNKYYPIINNVACIGEASSKHFLYSRWLNMIKRCYDVDCEDYHNYGAMGVTVCNKWKCFEYYIQGVKNVEGYDEKLIKSNKLELDKDKKNGTIYCPEYCTWITKTENVNIDNLKQLSKLKPFVAKNILTNEIIETKGINNFAKENNLIYSCIVRCLNGERKQHKNWVFKYL